MEENTDFRREVTPALENSIKSSCVKGASKGRSFDVKSGDEMTSLFPRDTEKSAEGTISSDLVERYAKGARCLNAGARRTFPFQQMALGTGPVTGKTTPPG